jgi:glycosyltransferase involved in cell wall biosynthesis
LAAIAQIDLGRDAQRVLHSRNEQFQRAIPTADLEKADVVIGFDTSSWILARRCRKLGTPFVLMQTIGHPDSNRRVHDEIATRFPQWADTAVLRLPVVREAEQEEHETADLIVASSTFTRQTLVENGVPSEKIRVAPYGVDVSQFSNARVTAKRPFRFVFVGLITARKGVPLLVEAWRRLSPTNAELCLVGPVSKKVRALIPTLPGLRYLGSFPHVELPKVLQQCDVLVFPSYFEGFGLVLLEAMACGLPVVTTMATAGPDLLRKGQGGWLIPTGSVELLAAAMAQCLDHADKIPVLGREARKLAEEFTWKEYGRRLLVVLQEAKKSGAAAVTARTLLAAPRALLVHPGTQYSGHLASQLHRRGYLDAFWTCLAFSDQSRVDSFFRILPDRLRYRLSSRVLTGVPRDRLLAMPWPEVAALARRWLGLNELKTLRLRNARLQRALPDVAIRRADVVIGFDTSSWIIARRAQRHGCPFVLDQSIGHSRFLEHIRERLAIEFPDWTERRLVKTEEDLALEDQEHAEAALIVVPSRFVLKTLEQNGVSTAKIRVNPFGVNLQRFSPAEFPPEIKPVRFIFVGSLQSRKGLPLLFKAWEQVAPNKEAELWVVGGGRLPESAKRRMPDNVRLHGRVTHRELPAILRKCHAFIFPSYFEGLAQIKIEAASCGLPVIGTENTGCAEIVRNNETGYVLPVGDLEALCETLGRLITNPEIILAMRERLLLERHAWSWDAYGDRWADLISEVRKQTASALVA